MFEHLLIAIDGSDSSLAAAEAAIDLAAKLHARLDMLSVEETPPRYISAHEETTREHTAALAYFERLHAPLLRKAEQRGVQVQSSVRSGHEGQVMLDYLVAEACDLLVLGYQGHSGVWGAFLGSTADKVMTHAPCSTLIMRKQGRMVFKSILLAFDGSPLSWQGLQAACQLATLYGAQLHALSVIESSQAPTVTGQLVLPQELEDSTPRVRELPPAQGDWQAYFQRVQSSAVAQAQLAHVSLETHLLNGSASATLATAAQELGSDLLVLGATGHEHPWNTTIGGTARKVANEATCAVLIVRPPALHSHVRDIMDTTIHTIAPRTPIAEVITQLIEQQTRIVMVVNEQQQVQGVITLGTLLTQEEMQQHLNIQQAMTAQQFSAYLQQFFTNKLAEEVMKRPVITVKADTPLDAAARWMMTQHVTRVPVVDEANRPVGLLDQAALLTYYTAQGQVQETEQAHEVTPQNAQNASPRTIGDVRVTAVPLVKPEMPLPEVSRLLQTTPLRRVIVVNEAGKAIGVIGDNDLLASQGITIDRHPLLALASRIALFLPEELVKRRPAQEPPTARQVMRPRLVSVTPTTPITEAVQLMLVQHIKRLVVIDEAGIPLGMVSREHVLHVLVEQGTKEEL